MRTSTKTTSPFEFETAPTSSVRSVSSSGLKRKTNKPTLARFTSRLSSSQKVYSRYLEREPKEYLEVEWEDSPEERIESERSDEDDESTASGESLSGRNATGNSDLIQAREHQTENLVAEEYIPEPPIFQDFIGVEGMIEVAEVLWMETGRVSRDAQGSQVHDMDVNEAIATWIQFLALHIQ
ncbi:hypothetical protein K469DRAFT_796401 [Zopfia rhizophila CBS 207.26]|uniref:Uncharacterized protein n=1 Tax=Zopfia rhizophila CBS 207.26 TaxID=1314779 RepID=A0A6A6DQL2_9PEZI|nr:hypothetical protein K469DRAFT_796401 [Zopfia rhizophila CBS 207.26]